MKPVYLDHASTTPCDPRVLDAMLPFFGEQGGNASSPHLYGRQAHKAIEAAREKLASFIHAKPVEIVFTASASESNNQAVGAAAHARAHLGRHIIASAIEHHSVLEPLHRLGRGGYEVTLINPKTNGLIDPQAVIDAMREDTILVCVQHANNEVGTIQPVSSIGQQCQLRGILFLVDATQTVGHVPVNIGEFHCDFLSLAAHKFYGPQGVGALYIRQGLDVPSLILGGDQERGRRAGTPNTPGIVGLGKAIELSESYMIQAAVDEAALRDKVIDGVLTRIPGVTLNGCRQQRLPNNAHMAFDRINGEDLVSALDMVGIAASMGSACTWGRLEPSHVLKAMGLSVALSKGSLRITVGRWTKLEDVAYLLEQLKVKVASLRQ